MPGVPDYNKPEPPRDLSLTRMIDNLDSHVSELLALANGVNSQLFGETLPDGIEPTKHTDQLPYPSVAYAKDQISSIREKLQRIESTLQLVRERV